MHKFAITTTLILFGMGGATAQTVQGVRPDSSPLQVGVGFNFVSFYELPNHTVNGAGVNGSVVYYHDDIGVEAAISDAFGSTNGQTSQILFSGGGVRLSWPNTRTIRPWAHGLIGYSHLSPKVPLESQSAVGYKAGAGVDFNPRHSRLGFRVSADLFGTRFFRTYQISPEISAGVVLAIGH